MSWCRSLAHAWRIHSRPPYQDHQAIPMASRIGGAYSWTDVRCTGGSRDSCESPSPTAWWPIRSTSTGCERPREVAGAQCDGKAFMRCGCTSTLDQPNSLPGGALDASRNQEGILQLSDCLKDVLPNDLSRDGFQHGMSKPEFQRRCRSELGAQRVVDAYRGRLAHRRRCCVGQ